MAFHRRHLIAPLAAGAAALSIAGTGAAFAATGTHSVKPVVATVKHATETDLKADRTGKDTTKERSKDATSDRASTGTTKDPASKDPASTDPASPDRTGTTDR